MRSFARIGAQIKPEGLLQPSLAWSSYQEGSFWERQTTGISTRKKKKTDKLGRIEARVLPLIPS